MPDWITERPIEPGPSALEALEEDLGAPDQRILALLDAAMVPNLVETLTDLEVDRACLFRGEAAEEFGDAAPWVVDLGTSAVFREGLLTRSDAPWHYWDRLRPVLLRSGWSVADAAKHFRRFLRTDPTAAERGAFFRFYDGMILADYLAGTASDPSRAARLLRAEAKGVPISDRAWIIAHPADDTILVADLSGLPTDRTGPRPFDDLDRRALRDGADRRLVSDVGQRLDKTFRKLDPDAQADGESYGASALRWIRGQGQSIDEAEDVFQLALLGFMLGNAANDVLRGPIMSDRLIPVSQRIAVARDGLISEARRVTEEKEI